jgi:hypothetical protein
MNEGELYPELRYVNMLPTRIRIASLPDFNLMRQGQAYDLARHIINEVPGLQVEIPESDWNRIMDIYHAHYHAANRNPAVQEAWQQYRMLIALTETKYSAE